MEHMGWSWNDLMNTPYERYLDISRIISIEQKEEMKEKQKQEQRAKRGR